MCSGRGDGPLRPIRLPYSEIPGYVWLPTNRGLSQAPTSFFGSWCQGIHRVPLSTWQLQMMLASTVQFSRYGRSRTRFVRDEEGAGPGRRLAAGANAPQRPFPQDPTACSARPSPEPTFLLPEGSCTSESGSDARTE